MASYTTHLDIAYPGATSPRQALDLFLPPTAGPSSPLLVYVHGGAWRSESKSDFTHTLVPLLIQHTRLPVACLEYRLAPADPHPAQIVDVISGLSLLAGPLLPLEEGEAKWDRKKLVVAGHSAGAFMAATLILRPPSPSPSLPSFDVPAPLRHSISHIICIDGIYDLPTLLDEYPSYDSFVHEAFGRDPAVLAAESPARWGLYEEEGSKTRVALLHSAEDELLSFRQPRVFLRRMRQLLGGSSGRALREEADEAVGEEEKDLPEGVVADFVSLKGGHYEVVRRAELAQTIARILR
ncbi:hypothetical protein NBRC10513v2_001307 [Rhodotorula toruloides]